ncbi:hypothetical protein [Lignipirellula cremea]|uniref:Uncharacterized protein n=1 Tax=Lignipirellula cremea TaxID=2528010 RepID=A0A518DLN0_9BACT|nr:hypothetical protein [Lignipirellula cremea]QDU92754.1 hypothetical protein Pla8534_05030 [Lignipirellula cremea]
MTRNTHSSRFLARDMLLGLALVLVATGAVAFGIAAYRNTGLEPQRVAVVPAADDENTPSDPLASPAENGSDVDPSAADDPINPAPALPSPDDFISTPTPSGVEAALLSRASAGSRPTETTTTAVVEQNGPQPPSPIDEEPASDPAADLVGLAPPAGPPAREPVTEPIPDLVFRNPGEREPVPADTDPPATDTDPLATDTDPLAADTDPSATDTDPLASASTSSEPAASDALPAIEPPADLGSPARTPFVDSNPPLEENATDVPASETGTSDTAAEGASSADVAGANPISSDPATVAGLQAELQTLRAQHADEIAEFRQTIEGLHLQIVGLRNEVTDSREAAKAFLDTVKEMDRLQDALAEANRQLVEMQAALEKRVSARPVTDANGFKSIVTETTDDQPYAKRVSVP